MVSIPLLTFEFGEASDLIDVSDLFNQLQLKPKVLKLMCHSKFEK